MLDSWRAFHARLPTCRHYLMTMTMIWRLQMANCLTKWIIKDNVYKRKNIATCADVHIQHTIHTNRRYLPRNLCGFGERLVAMNFQLSFHIPLNHCVVVVQLYLPKQHRHIASSLAFVKVANPVHFQIFQLLNSDLLYSGRNIMHTEVLTCAFLITE